MAEFIRPPSGLLGGVATIGEIGRAWTELPAGAPPQSEPAPDHCLSEHEVDGLIVRAASIRGVMHRRQETERQDAYSVTWHEDTQSLLVLVCDGVGSRANSRYAAEYVCRTVPRRYTESRDLEAAIRAANDDLLRLDRDDMATTAVATVLSRRHDGLHLDYAWTDDSTVWRLGADGGWHVLTKRGAGSDSKLHTGSVRALPHSDPRIMQGKATVRDGAVFLMSDGVGDAIQISDEVRSQLSAWWEKPSDIFTFGREVGFARRGLFDDRTVVGIWVRTWLEGGPVGARPFIQGADHVRGSMATDGLQ